MQTAQVTAQVTIFTLKLQRIQQAAILATVTVAAEGKAIFAFMILIGRGLLAQAVIIKNTVQATLVLVLTQQLLTVK